MNEQDTRSPDHESEIILDKENLPTINQLLVADLKRAKMTKLGLSKALGISAQAITNWSFRNYIPSRHISSILAALNETGRNGQIARAQADGTLRALEERALKKHRFANEIIRGTPPFPREWKLGEMPEKAKKTEGSKFYIFTDENGEKTIQEVVSDRRRLLEIEIKEDEIGAILRVEEDFSEHQHAFHFATMASSRYATKKRLRDYESSKIRNWFSNEHMIADIYELPMYKDADGHFFIGKQGHELPLLNLLVAACKLGHENIRKKVFFVISRSELYNLTNTQQRQAKDHINWIKERYIKPLGEDFISLVTVSSLTDAVTKTMEINQSLTERI
jgi:hypothetical protein